MENHHVSWVNHQFLWAIYTMAMLVITRGYNLPNINSWVLQLGRRCAAHFDGPWRPKQGATEEGNLAEDGWGDLKLSFSVFRSEDMDICFFSVFFEDGFVMMLCIMLYCFAWNKV